MIFIELLLSFLQIGLLSIGGGYAALPIIQEQVVNLHGWLDMREFADILTISPMPQALWELKLLDCQELLWPLLVLLFLVLSLY